MTGSTSSRGSSSFAPHTGSSNWLVFLQPRAAALRKSFRRAVWQVLGRELPEWALQTGHFRGALASGYQSLSGERQSYSTSQERRTQLFTHPARERRPEGHLNKIGLPLCS